jgi:hypothetical protein
MRQDGTTVRKPSELIEAEMVYGLCQAYSSLPESGAVMDQPVSVLRMHGILHASGYFERT